MTITWKTYWSSSHHLDLSTRARQSTNAFQYKNSWIFCIQAPNRYVKCAFEWNSQNLESGASTEKSRFEWHAFIDGSWSAERSYTWVWSLFTATTRTPTPLMLCTSLSFWIHSAVCCRWNHLDPNHLKSLQTIELNCLFNSMYILTLFRSLRSAYVFLLVRFLYGTEVLYNIQYHFDARTIKINMSCDKLVSCFQFLSLWNS